MIICICWKIYVCVGMKNGLIEFLIRYEEMVIIRNEFNKINIVDIFFEMVRFFFYLIFLKCIYSFFLLWKRKNMLYFCYFILIIIIFYLFVCNIFLICLIYFCFLLYMYNFIIFIKLGV